MKINKKAQYQLELKDSTGKIIETTSVTAENINGNCRGISQSVHDWVLEAIEGYQYKQSMKRG